MRSKVKSKGNRIRNNKIINRNLDSNIKSSVKETICQDDSYDNEREK
jgi:hypothetical protein